MSASAGMNPEDVYRYSTRYLPTISIMAHSTKLLREGKYDPNFKDGRAHDAKIIEDDLPREAAQLLLLDLEITQRNFKDHRVVIVSSPYRRCIETATIVAQEMGVESIQIYYDFGEAVSDSRDAGWDFAYEPLTVSPGEMDDFVFTKSEDGVHTHNSNRVSIDNIVGRQLSVDDVQENDVRYQYRVGEALNQVQASLEQDGDHVVIVGHPSTIQSAAIHFLGADMKVYHIEDCGCLTLASPSDASSWIAGNFRMKIKPIRTENPNLKIGFQLENDAFGVEPSLTKPLLNHKSP